MAVDTSDIPRQQDYLEQPVRPKQSTPEDGLYALEDRLVGYLKDIRHEMLKDHPSVLATVVADGNPVLISNGRATKLTFTVGGKPVMVHKLLIWRSSNSEVYMSPHNMSNLREGFIVGTIDGSGVVSPIELNISVDEMYIWPVSTDVTLNTPNPAIGNRQVSIYAWTIPNYERNDYR